MTSDRPYRRALTFAAAREEIAQQSGRQFDPSVVTAFLSIPEEVWKEVSQERSKVSPLQASA
jgi:HD-GYP domain-containing protein (c-di-GMP phosphodiesterase class II)